MPMFAICTVLALVLAGAAPASAAVDFEELAQTVPVGRVQQTMDYFANLGSRGAGYPGADQAAKHVQERFNAVGLDDITVHEYDVSIPMDKGGCLRIETSGEQLKLHGLWPNLV